MWSIGIASLCLATSPGQTIDEDLLRPAPGLSSDASNKEAAPSSGLLFRLYGQGLAGFYGDAFYSSPEPTIPEGAFGFGGLLGGEIEGRLLLGLWAEVLLGGLNDDALGPVEGFGISSRRTSFGLGARFNLGRGRLRPYLGLDGAYMRQNVRLRSRSGVAVPIRNRFGRTVGVGFVPDAQLDARHEGLGLGPVAGLRVRLTDSEDGEVSFFAEASLLREWWRAEGVRGSARSEDREALGILADGLEDIQGSPGAWAGTLRIGLQFGP